MNDDNVSELLRLPADAPWIDIDNALYPLVSAPDGHLSVTVHGATLRLSAAIKAEIRESVE